jgi:hypothetical protein
LNEAGNVNVANGRNDKGDVFGQIAFNKDSNASRLLNANIASYSSLMCLALLPYLRYVPIVLIDGARLGMSVARE